MDIDPATRGARADEAIEAMRVLWRDDEATFHGQFFDFERACSFSRSGSLMPSSTFSRRCRSSLQPSVTLFPMMRRVA